MSSIEEIRKKLDEIEKNGWLVEPFREKWAHLLYPSILEMIPITGDTFNMGSNHEDNECPVHAVTLSPFYMAKYPVTWAKWKEVRDWGERNDYIFNRNGRIGGGDITTNETHPVTDVIWYDAVLWCNALSEMEARTPCYYTSKKKTKINHSGEKDIQNDWVDWAANGYRLPTEAEWEYACRAGTGTRYSCGNAISVQDANYAMANNGTMPFGSYAANGWGLCDMHGNVMEWCGDRYESEYYRINETNDPRGPSSGCHRVLRGGGWFKTAEYLRSAYRSINFPDYAADYIGFRPVCSQSR